MLRVILLYKHEHIGRVSNLHQLPLSKEWKKRKKVVHLFVWITQSFLCNAFPVFKTYFLQCFIFSKECQDFNKGCCQYDLIKREMAGLFVCSRKLSDSKR